MVKIYEVTGSISDLTMRFFFKGGVNVVTQASIKYSDHSINMVTTAFVCSHQITEFDTPKAARP